MSNESAATQTRNLSFSIENILREDFPPKSRLEFPPREYFLPATATKESFASPNLRWVPFTRYTTAYWPLYYRRFMYVPAYRLLPMESRDDNRKKESEKASLDCKSTRSEEDDTIHRSPSPVGQDENHVHEHIEETTTHNSTEEPLPSEDKESKSRKRRSRSQFTAMQIKYLETYYSNHSYLSRDERTVLAQALDMTELQIRNWFQNKRYHKKMKMQSKDEES